VSENQVKNAIIEYLTYRGALVLRINSGAVAPEADNGKRRFLSFVKWFALGVSPAEQGRGVSDILAIHSGRAYFIETKAPGKRRNVSTGQARFMDEARARGAVCVVATCIEDIAEVIR
jgi:hypothetical protein